MAKKTFEKGVKVEPKTVCMTAEYLYEKGIKYYEKASEKETNNNLSSILTTNSVLDIEPKNNESSENILYVKSMIYLQGAMFLGSENASQRLITIYKEHSKINNEQVSNLIKIITSIEKFSCHAKKTNSMCLRDFGITDYSELKELALIESGYINIMQHDWNKISIINSSILPTLEQMIEEFNSHLPPEYYLITNETIIGYQEKIQEKVNENIINKTFTLLGFEIENPFDKIQISETGLIAKIADYIF